MEQSAVEWVNNNFEKQIINEDIYASKNGIIESHIIFAKSQQQGFSEEEVFKMINDFCFDWNYNYKGELSQKEYLIEWFEKYKK
jgi:hypothetical protein